MGQYLFSITGYLVDFSSKFFSTSRIFLNIHPINRYRPVKGKEYGPHIFVRINFLAILFEMVVFIICCLLPVAICIHHSVSLIACAEPWCHIERSSLQKMYNKHNLPNLVFSAYFVKPWHGKLLSVETAKTMLSVSLFPRVQIQIFCHLNGPSSAESLTLTCPTLVNYK